MSEFPVATVAALPGVMPAALAPDKHARPFVRESWMQGYNPVTDAAPVVRFGAVFVSPGRYRDPATGHHMDANCALLDPDACPECATEYGPHGEIVADFRYMVRVEKPEHLFATKPVFDFTYCRSCLTPSEVETQRQQLLDGMPAQPPQPRRKARRTRAWVP